MSFLKAATRSLLYSLIPVLRMRVSDRWGVGTHNWEVKCYIAVTGSYVCSNQSKAWIMQIPKMIPFGL
jgi:hypothetical protein